MVKRKNTNLKGKKEKILLIVIAMLCITNLFTVGLCVNNSKTNVSLHKIIKKQKKTIRNQERNISELKNTKDIRNYNSLKKVTNQGLKNATDALYNWEGIGFAKRYTKAKKYMKMSALNNWAINGKLPTENELRDTAKDYEEIKAKNEVTELQNGIQDIKGNKVSGFVWVTEKYTSFNKNTTQTQQIQYTYDISTKKFTKFELLPFSGQISE